MGKDLLMYQLPKGGSGTSPPRGGTGVYDPAKVNNEYLANKILDLGMMILDLKSIILDVKEEVKELKRRFPS